MRLRLWLPPLAELRADSRFAFQVLDGQRRVRRRGEAVIAGLPQGMDCELVLHALDAVLLEVRLPKLTGARLAQALPALVEERIAGDLERSHVVASPRDAQGRAAVAVVDRAELRRALDLFERAGERIVAATPQPLALAFVPGRWRVRLSEGQGSVRTGPAAGVGFSYSPESPPEPPLELRLLLTQAAAPPAGIDVDGAVDLGRWSEALGVPVQAAPVETAAAPVVLDLLQYAFARGVIRWHTWRASAALGAALLLVTAGGLNLHAWSLHRREQALREAVVGVFRDSFPQVPVVLDPLAQMRRGVENLRIGAGTGSGDFLALAAGLAQLAEPDSVQSIEYGGGQFRVRFGPQVADGEATRAALSQRAAKAGLVLSFSAESAQLARREPR